MASATLYEIDRSLPFLCLVILMAMLFLMFATRIAGTRTTHAVGRS